MSDSTDSTAIADTAITRFFREFEERASGRDGAAQAALFADSFLAASPQGAQCVRASDFALALPKRKEMFGKLGLQASRLVGLEEIPLDARHVLVRTRWRMDFENRDHGTEGTREKGTLDTKRGKPSQSVLVDSVFIVDTGAPEYRIILYLACQDIMSVLKERGILGE